MHMPANQASHCTEATPLKAPASARQPETVGRRVPLQIERLLVVVDDPDDPATDSLLHKASRIATTLHAELALFQACYDPRLAGPRIRLGDESPQQKEDRERRMAECVDAAAMRLAERALELQAETGLSVRHQALWGEPAAALIIQQALETGADLIMKTSSQSNYVVGLLTNTDWELIRRSPAHVWFVTSDGEPPKQLLAAIGAPDTDDEIFGSEDYDVCAFAQLLAGSLETRSTILHTYTIPPQAGGFGQLAHDPTGTALLAQAHNARRATLSGRHRQAIQALIDYFQLDVEDLRVMEGRTSDVVTDLAASLSADAIIMGAASLNRLERFLKPVAAEPVLAKADCDVIFVRAPVAADELPETQGRALSGLPAVDLEQAVVDPGVVFNQSPGELAADDRLSVRMRRRLLQIWESDLRAEMTEEDEGGPTRASRANLLGAIHRAREHLEAVATSAQSEAEADK